MARDTGLEELLREELGERFGLTEKLMFGGWVVLLNGHLLCGAREDGMLVRLGKGNDGWALSLNDIKPMLSGARIMHGWVRAGPDAYGNDAVRKRLLLAALDYVGALPAK
ncbi:MAG: cold-shock protein [Rhizobiaceae bacterium]|nr:cold-shock protein [Rhizobiaceae bacterium]